MWSSQGRWAVRGPDPGCFGAGSSGARWGWVGFVPLIVVSRGPREDPIRGGSAELSGLWRGGSGSRVECGRRKVSGLCDDHIRGVL